MLTALDSVRRERLCCEQLGYNLLWRWFLDREFAAGRFNHSVFAKNYARVRSAAVAKLFFSEVYDRSRAAGWTSAAHFTAAGTLIEAWASLKSFVRKDGADDPNVQSAKDEDPGNPTINFRGEPRRNDPHHSTPDADSVLYRQASGQEARRCFGAHALMENRHGLCADFTRHNPLTASEPVVALQPMDAHTEWYSGGNVRTVGADKGCHQKGFVPGCREREMAPPVACKDKVQVAGLDGRTTPQQGYQVSLQIRKRVEEIFGWISRWAGSGGAGIGGWSGRRRGAASWPGLTIGCGWRDWGRRREPPPSTGQKTRGERNGRGSAGPSTDLRSRGGGQPLPLRPR